MYRYNMLYTVLYVLIQYVIYCVIDKTLKVHQVNDWQMLRSSSISSLVSQVSLIHYLYLTYIIVYP